MTGDDDKAFQTLMERYPSSCPCWYHMMVGKLLFCYPTIISSDYELLQVAEVRTCLLSSLYACSEFNICTCIVCDLTAQ